MIDLTAPAIDATQPPSRVLPVFSDINELLDSLALARWDGALSFSRGHPQSKLHLDSGDLPTLRKGKWFSSVIVDCFAEQLNATQGPIKSLNTPDAHMFTVQLYAFLATKEYNYSNVNRRVRSARIDRSSTSHILVPVDVNKNHYVLVDVDRNNAKVVILYLRSRSRWNRENVLGNVRRMVQDALTARDIST